MTATYRNEALAEATAEAAKARVILDTEKIGSRKWVKASNAYELWTSKKAYLGAVPAHELTA